MMTKERRRNGLALGLALVVPFVAAFIGGIATSRSVSTWYQDLKKPSWNPPAWLFGPVWTVLYAMMGVASWRVWRRGRDERLESHPEVAQQKREAANRALNLYAIHLVFNTLWSVLFFGLRRVDWALAELVLLWSLILATLTRFYRIDAVAGLLLVPYQLWSTFAAFLNAKVWQLNR